MIKKIITIGVILLFVGLSLSPINAAEINTNEAKDEKIELVLTDVDSEGKLISKIFLLTEAEYNTLQAILTKILAEINILGNTKSVIGDIMDVILRWLNDKLPYLYEIVMIILTRINEIKDNISNGLGNLAKYTIVSMGQGYKLNPFKISSMTIRKRAFTFWHYSGTGAAKGITYINFPSTLKGKIISGRQIGYMSNFTGFYLYNAKEMPKQSFTFFVGRAEFAMAFRLKLLGNLDLLEKWS